MMIMGIFLSYLTHNDHAAHSSFARAHVGHATRIYIWCKQILTPLSSSSSSCPFSSLVLMDDSPGNDHDESSTQPKKSSWLEVQTTGKRIRISSSPEIVNQSSSRPVGCTQQLLPPPIATKIPPITIKFESGNVGSDREIGADLIDSWQNSHNRRLSVTVRFGHMQCLLVFANDCNTFEDLLEQPRWPALLKGAQFKIQFPRILPSEYSIVIRQFHKNWVESEVEEELRAEHPTLVKLTRMFVKEGTPLNLVRADFKSISQVKQLLHK